jgi:NAD(P)-dependent dehydrogenase (short-subunit alcohol dehydrogenase family)
VTNFRFLEKFFHINSFDIVLNVSGLNYDCLLHKYDEENMHEVDKVIDVNVKGNINLLSTCLPMMRKQGFGRVILMSSVLSTMPVPGTSIYSASKAFADSLIRTATMENLSKGITCNSIQLGYFDAGMAHRIPNKILDKIIEKIPLKRLGKMDELEQAIEFLINTEYVSGTSIKINGGIYL